MNYALIENGIVANIIWLLPINANDFPSAVPINNVLVNIGDEYKDGTFYRDGNRVLTNLEMMQQVLNEKNAIIAELDAALLDMAYENIMGGLE